MPQYYGLIQLVVNYNTLIMQTTQTPAKALLNHHLQAFMNNDMDEVMKGYAEDAEVWTPNGTLVGTEAIASFLSYAFTVLPKGPTSFELKENVIKENKAYIVWNADSPVVSIPLGTDCFECRGDKIVWQTATTQIIKK